MPTTPINGLPSPVDGSPNLPPIHFDALNAVLDTRLLPRFANAAARNSAITAPVAGMYVHMLDDKRLWTYDGTQWTWPAWAQGLLVRAEYEAASPTLLSNTALDLPAFNVTMGALPAGRRLRMEFSGQVMSTVANTTYGFVLGFAGVQRRGQVQIPVDSTTGSPVAQNFQIVREFTQASALGVANGGINAGARIGGGGLCYLVTTTTAPKDGPAQFAIYDMGAA